jgi:hypothetical protein
MNIQLIQGVFSSKDALELISQMMDKKIRFHESKISKSDSLEDIKYRESKIKKLQNEMDQLKKHIKSDQEHFQIESTITITPSKK